ncbi:MAG: hypothetical protein IJ571_06700 [Ruminococcus sp.]|nr:hypothetical protein [Ruminococcus sp.]
MPMVYCNKCGKLVSTRAELCCRCGEKIAGPEELELFERRRVKKERIKTTALLLLVGIILAAAIGLNHMGGIIL